MHICQIPAGGGLLIEGPVGFEFPNPCTPEAEGFGLRRRDSKLMARGREVAPAARGATYQVEPMAGNVLRWALPFHSGKRTLHIACSLPMEVACSYQQTTGPTGRSIIRPTLSFLGLWLWLCCNRLTAGASGIMPSPELLQIASREPVTVPYSPVP